MPCIQKGFMLCPAYCDCVKLYIAGPTLNHAVPAVTVCGRAGQGRAGQGRAGQGRAGQGRAGQGWAGLGRGGAGQERVSALEKVT